MSSTTSIFEARQRHWPPARLCDAANRLCTPRPLGSSASAGASAPRQLSCYFRNGRNRRLRTPRRGQGDQWELYNLTEDISETNDLAASLPEKRSEMIAAWEAMNRQMIDPVWSPNSRR